MANNERGVYSPSQEPHRENMFGRILIGGILGAVVIGIPAIALHAAGVAKEETGTRQRALRARVLARATHTDPRVIGRARGIR